MAPNEKTGDEQGDDGDKEPENKTVCKPMIDDITISLATREGGTDANRPHVVNLAAVAISDEASLIVTGQNFTEKSVVRLNNLAATTALSSSTELIAKLTPTTLSKPGEYRVKVFTPGSGCGLSNAKSLFVEPEPQWGWLEKGLIGGAAVAAAVWVYWILISPTTRNEPANWFLTWLVMIAILALFTLGIGRALTGTWKSLLIDERNKQSLSRLQLVLWTLLVVSGIVAATAWNIHNGVDDPLGLGVPSELWVLLGISTTALIGSNLIKTQQGTVDLDPGTAQEILDKVEGSTEGTETATQKRIENVSIVQARWTDMFKGETEETFHTLDVGKIQMFFFTVVLVLAYAAAFARTAFVVTSYTLPGKFQFPAFDGSLVALLGISSVAYLLNKAGKAV